MSRPRTTSDEAVLAGLSRAISRLGPVALTLADLGEDTGLSPAALVQRFGSKRGLLLALAQRRPAEVREDFAAARQAQASPLEALMAALAAAVHDADTPKALANQLAFVQMELGDADFHRPAFEHARAMLDEIRAQLESAVGASELAACDTEYLARSVQTAYTGALVTWAIYRQGTLDEWLRGEVEAVLEPFLP
jgi:AcrR family transcriptional regulator